MTNAVPAIDIAPFLSGEPTGKASVAEDVARAAETIGFVVLTGHGIPHALLETVFQKGFEFFDQPDQDKAKWHPAGPAKQRGYHGVATRGLSATLGKHAPKDLRESLFLGPLDDHAAKFAHIPEAATAYAPNLIPNVPSGFDTALIELYRAFETLSSNLLRIFAVAARMPEDHFSPLIKRHFSIMSAHHYPALSKPPLPGQLRTGAHTDYGAMTILAMTEAKGGLEVQRGDTWVPVHPPQGALVVNLGDMMQRWTNDRWVSTMHRVATPEDLNDAMSRRMSVGYFMHPDYDAKIECLPSCRSDGALYPPITAGAHIRAKIEASHKG
ncbi:MAG: isopenicillin N synthase family oxygenase [Silicimonas sp.]|nr:isopenicillin N synthase family oxygenase [Silicimonas sp.]